MPRTAQQPRARKPERKGRFRIRVAYLVLVVLMVLFSLKFVQKMQEVKSLQQQTAALRAANQQLAQDNKQVQGSIGWYHTAAYLEDEARAVFGYTKAGEVAVITRAHRQPIVQVRAAPVQSLGPPPPIWRQWWSAFFG